MRTMAIQAFGDGNGVVLGSDSYSLVYDPATKLAKIILEELVCQNANHAIKN